MSDQKRMLDLERAQFSLTKVKQIKGNFSEAEADSYADYTERLPAAILGNGLGQALAQLRAAAVGSENEKTDPHYLLYRDIQDWLCREDPRAPYAKAEDLLEALITGDRSTYLRARAETMALLEWHKKLAVAYLKQPETVGENGNG